VRKLVLVPNLPCSIVFRSYIWFTFFGGLLIGLVNCWQIALLTLATGPFIVAAGGISNIFLHRLAENIQDAYGEAASIAEQVCVIPDFAI
jgi:hypothetical protein